MANWPICGTLCLCLNRLFLIKLHIFRETLCYFIEIRRLGHILFSRPQNAGTSLLSPLQHQKLDLNAVLENMPFDTGLQNKAPFSTLIVGESGTENRTWPGPP
jgi:hypothetical protein